MDTAGSDASQRSDDLSDTERAIFGNLTPDELLSFHESYARQSLGAGISRVLFRRGRIDSVWGAQLDDGRSGVIKVHRPPADMEAIRAAHEAQRQLTATGFPCPLPLAGPSDFQGQTVTAETLMRGSKPDGRQPADRRLLADGLARHIDLLRPRTDLAAQAGPGPSWCRYQGGPWPVPHDTIVDFSSTPTGYEWLDDFGQRAADQITTYRVGRPTVVAHADWYAGNSLTSDGVLVGTFDWELVADTEAVIAGLTAAGYASNSTAGGGLSSPEETAQFLDEYARARRSPFTADERRAAAGAAAWIVAFNARWQVALLGLGVADHATIALAERRGEDYLGLAWE